MLREKIAPPCLAMRAERAAASLDIGLTTFLKWVREGKMPKGVEIGGCVLYDYDSVRRAWEDLSNTTTRNPFD